MNHVVKDIPWNGTLIELDDPILIEEWKAWNRKYQENYTSEICEEGKPIFDKIRERYGINTLIQIGYLKDNHDIIGITISDIPVGDTIFHPSTSGWSNNNVFATSIEKDKF